MKIKFSALVLYVSSICAPFSHALVISPQGEEVEFSYQATFTTAKTGPSVELALKHVQYLFGYMQSAQLVKDYGINSRTQGIGTPSWPAEIQILEKRNEDGKKVITYQASGILFINKLMSKQIKRDGYWDVFLPYDTDNYFIKDCSSWDTEITEEGFWYYYDPFLKGCSDLIEEPFAKSVKIKIQPTEKASANLESNFEVLQDDNGNGEIFDIVTINGFDKEPSQSDDGRVAFENLNAYFESNGYTKTELQRYEDRPIVRFEKDLIDKKGDPIKVRVTRLLAKTDLGLKNVTFAKFFKNAIDTADVIVFAGHSGANVMIDLAEIEEKAGKIDFDYNKNQLFFFDACSSYAYYLPMFEGKKKLGTIGVLSFGLTSQFGYESAMHQSFFDHLLDLKGEDPTWMEVMEDMERSLRGMTFLLNYWTP